MAKTSPAAPRGTASGISAFQDALARAPSANRPTLFSFRKTSSRAAPARTQQLSALATNDARATSGSPTPVSSEAGAAQPPQASPQVLELVVTPSESCPRLTRIHEPTSATRTFDVSVNCHIVTADLIIET